MVVFIFYVIDIDPKETLSSNFDEEFVSLAAKCQCYRGVPERSIALLRPCIINSEATPTCQQSKRAVVSQRSVVDLLRVT